MISRRVWLIAGIAGCFALSMAAGPLVDRLQPYCPASGRAEGRPPRRIVSLAPSVTQILFELGLGERVVGVTSFCRFPAEARQLPKVGGVLDPDYEAILALRPELVIELIEHEQSLPGLAKLGLPRLVVCHQDVESSLESITTIGRACAAEPQAQRLRKGLEARLHQIQQLTASRPRPAVLLVVDRTWGAGRIEDVYVAGSDGHLNRALHLAGGRNVCASAHVPFPVVSAETILRLKPEVIVDLVFEEAAQRLGQQRIRRDWQQLDRLPAVGAGRVFVVADDRVKLPGPNVVRLVECLAGLLHPEVAELLHPEIDWQRAERP